MPDHALTEGFNSELLENAFHVSQTIASCTSQAHLLDKFLLVTLSEGPPTWHTPSDILPFDRRHGFFDFGSRHIVAILGSLPF